MAAETAPPETGKEKEQDNKIEIEVLQKEISDLKASHEKEILALKEENNTLKTKLVNYLTIPPEAKKTEEEKGGLNLVNDWISGKKE